jgi:peptidyl-prolyl cis-trans isomerase B (cyclophilin B)
MKSLSMYEGSRRRRRMITNRNMSRIAGIVFVSATLLSASCSGQSLEPTKTTENQPAQTPKTYSAPPPMMIDTGKQYMATIETAKGNLILELFASDVPITVNNFIFLSREGFYNDTVFHRIIPGLGVQGGDPTGTGGGNPGYFFADEFTEHTHVTGALSMANSGSDTNGSQFFITYSPQHHLDDMHSVFGQLTEGMTVLEKIEQGDTLIRITIEAE